MKKTIQVNGDFKIVDVTQTNEFRLVTAKKSEIQRIGEDYPETVRTVFSDKITLSIDITLYGSGDTSELTTESVFGIIKTKLEELTIYP